MIIIIVIKKTKAKKTLAKKVMKLVLIDVD